jgi:acyl-CoA synthetase (NDP forming)
VVPAILATDADGAVQAAAQLGYPVVLKVASPDLLHKSDIGGVRLDVRDEPSVRAAFDDIVGAARRISPPPRVEGVLVSPMRSGGVELLTGIVRDPMWGQVLAVGLGGVWTEIFNDVSLRVLPVTAADVEAMLGELKGAALLRGARGSTAADVGALVDVILRIARLAQALPPDLESLEINPLRVQASQIEALDALVTWNAPSPDPPAAAPEHADAH